MIAHRMLLARLALCGVATGLPAAAGAWGDEGHEIVASIAEHYLDAGAQAEIVALLAGDDTRLVANRSVAAEATWADYYRDSDRQSGQSRYRHTRAWHYVDLEIAGPDLRSACNGRPVLAAGIAASAGPAEDCIVDKIEQFRGELADRAIPILERRIALQFLLHFIGDLHQPLHASDHHDRGGNDEQVREAQGPGGSLHHYWDTVFVERLGLDPQRVARQLIEEISASQRRRWSAGSVEDWARESFSVAKVRVYGRLPLPAADGAYRLPGPYTEEAVETVRLQLKRAGVRLAHVLNQALPHSPHTHHHMVNTIFPM